MSYTVTTQTTETKEIALTTSNQKTAQDCMAWLVLEPFEGHECTAIITRVVVEAADWS